MSDKKPLIFVTNDDSISAKGIHSLVEVVKDFGDIVIIAPDSPQSGMGHAITINEPLRLTASNVFDGLEAYECTGTPVDCVKLGVYDIMKRKPDLLVSGINHGTNAASNVLYSGTMSATIEGAMEGIPSVGFSLNSFDAEADFSKAKKIVRKIVAEVLERGLPEGVCLNVNIPEASKQVGENMKVCRQAHAFWEDSFDKRMDPHNKPYYWLTGEFLDVDNADDTDLYWLKKGWTTIVPTQYDLTAHKVINELNNWNL